VGSQQYNQKINLFTRIAYKYLFKKDFLHSVRDSYTYRKLKNIGINNVINTGCPTMWCLTQSHCQKVPKVKSKRVVFTLTDYKKNVERDNYMISVLNNEYDEVYFWPQGYGDFSYFSSLDGIDNVTLVPPHVLDFDQLLDEGDIDFIGTRLHGGIRALQKLKRTLIIGVDNRANELHKDFNLPVLDQTEIEKLSRIINQDIITDIKLPLDNINAFLAQFKTTNNKQL
jgi:polysaccharide pyruvyl transferase WcaK-like protein